MAPEVADREIALGVWPRRQGTDEGHAEVIIPSPEIPQMTKWRRARMAVSFAMVHLTWIRGPLGTLFEPDDLWPLPKWDDAEYILATATEADAQIIYNRIAPSFASEVSKDEKEILEQLECLGDEDESE